MHLIFECLKALLPLLCCQSWDAAVQGTCNILEWPKASPKRGLLPNCSRDPCSFPNAFSLFLEVRISVWGTDWAFHFLVSLRNRTPLPPITPLSALALCPSTPLPAPALPSPPPARVAIHESPQHYVTGVIITSPARIMPPAADLSPLLSFNHPLASVTLTGQRHRPRDLSARGHDL